MTNQETRRSAQDKSNVASNTLWVVDKDKIVYLYDDAGTSLGDWKANGLSKDKVQGIATDGTDNGLSTTIRLKKSFSMQSVPPSCRAITTRRRSLR